MIERPPQRSAEHQSKKKHVSHDGTGQPKTVIFGVHGAMSHYYSAVPPRKVHGWTCGFLPHSSSVCLKAKGSVKPLVPKGFDLGVATFKLPGHSNELFDRDYTGLYRNK